MSSRSYGKQARSCNANGAPRADPSRSPPQRRLQGRRLHVPRRRALGRSGPMADEVAPRSRSTRGSPLQKGPFDRPGASRSVRKGAPTDRGGVRSVQEGRPQRERASAALRRAARCGAALFAPSWQRDCRAKSPSAPRDRAGARCGSRRYAARRRDRPRFYRWLQPLVPSNRGRSAKLEAYGPRYRRCRRRSAA